MKNIEHMVKPELSSPVLGIKQFDSVQNDLTHIISWR